MRIIYFDHQKDKVDAYQNTVKDTYPITIEFKEIDVVELVKKEKVDIIVSPANSLGFMDGGIDMYYMQLFPGIQNRVQDRIKTFNITTALGRYVLPVGSAMLVSTKNKEVPLMACCPTMFLPENIQGKENVYYAFMGLLKMLSPLMDTNVTVACPSFGTGVGRMDPIESATQIDRALNDYFSKSNDEIYNERVKVMFWNKTSYILDTIPCDQEKNYQNTEIINIALNPDYQKLV